MLFSLLGKIKAFTLISNTLKTSAGSFVLLRKNFLFLRLPEWNGPLYKSQSCLVWKNVQKCRYFLSGNFLQRQLELSHLRELKFKYNFQNYLNQLCSCGWSVALTSHFFLHCPIFSDEIHTLRSTLNNIDYKILQLTNSYLTQTFYVVVLPLIQKQTH